MGLCVHRIKAAPTNHEQDFFLSDNAGIFLSLNAECALRTQCMLGVVRIWVPLCGRYGTMNAAEKDVSSGPGHAMRLIALFAHWR